MRADADFFCQPVDKLKYDKDEVGVTIFAITLSKYLSPGKLLLLSFII